MFLLSFFRPIYLIAQITIEQCSLNLADEISAVLNKNFKISFVENASFFCEEKDKL